MLKHMRILTPARLRAALVSLLIASALQPTAAASDVPRVVESLDLKQYAGRWYEVARLPNKFQAKCASDVEARYSLRDDGRIDVVNQCRTTEGKIHQADGVGRKAGDGKNSARLQVRFAPALLSFLPGSWGDYWVLGVGPEYTWAVVGTPSRENLWILSRTPEMSAPGYQRALEIARVNGFSVDQLMRTPQRGR
jgi:apolipoprotein D and lipocalin family protein